LTTACSAEDKVVSGCSASRSIDVYNGSFNVDNIKTIRILKSNQRSVYPIPSLNLINESPSFVGDKIFADFKEVISEPKNKETTMVDSGFSSYHIIVEFKTGNNACLHGRKTNSGFILQPMFTGDAFAVRNDRFYNLIMLWHNSSA
jgi:hypothetical protein